MKLFKTALAASALAMSASAAFAAPVEIDWWHAMGGANGERVDAMAKAFNESQDKYKVVPTNKGSYAETLTAAIAAFRAGDAPEIVQVFEVGTANMMAAKGAIKPIADVMKEAGVEFDQDKYLAAVTGYYTAPDGRMLSLPFNSSTPVLYYNKDMFKAAGLDPNKPPRTWDEMGEVAKKLRESGAACGFTTTWISWTQLENYSALHGKEFASKNNGFEGVDTELNIDQPFFVSHIQRLADWQKDKTFDYGGRTNKALPKFTSGECGMVMESSAGYGGITASAKFDWGIAPLPYEASAIDQPYNSIIGGASLWVMGGKDDETYKGVAEFLKFLSQPEIQAKWHQESGYLPITPAAYALTEEQGFYKAKPGADTSIKQMRPTEPAKIKGIRLGNFVQIRDIIDEELEKVWAGQATAEQALKAAKQRGDAELRKFEAMNK